MKLIGYENNKGFVKNQTKFQVTNSIGYENNKGFAKEPGNLSGNEVNWLR